MDESITIGADTSELRREMAAAAQQATQGGSAVSKGFERGAEGAGKLFEDSHRVAERLGQVTQTMLSGGTAADVMAGGMESLGRALRLPLGALAGITVAAAIGEKIAEMIDKARELREEVLALTSYDATAHQNSPLADLNKQLDDVRKKADEIRATPVVQSLLSDFLDKVIPGRTLERHKELQDLGENAAGIQKDIADKISEQADVSATRVDYGAAAGERQKLYDDYIEKHNANARKYTGDSLNEIQTALGRQYQLDQDAIDRKEAAATRQIAAEMKIAYIKSQGDDADMKSAQARLDAAQETYAAATNDQDRNTAGAEVFAAEKAVEEAKRTTEEKRNQLALEKAVAGLSGDAISKRRQQLQLEKEALETKWANATPDERRNIEVDQAKNAAENRANQEAAFAQQMSALRARQQAKTGRGPDEEIKAALNEIKDLNIELGNAKQLYGAQSSEVDEINAKIVVQKKRIEDIQFAEEQSLAAAKARTLELQLQADGQQLASKEASLRAQFEAQITQAIREGKTELAAQLRLQEQITLQQQEADEYLKTPQQKAQERDEARRRKHAEDVVKARDKDKADRAARGATDQISLGDAARDGASPAGTAPPGDAGSVADAHNAASARNAPPPPNAGVTGAAAATMSIKQMTVETMTVKTMHVDSIPCNRR